MIEFNDVLKLGCTEGNFLTILVNVDGITIWLDVRTELGSLNGFFDGSYDDTIEGLLVGESMRSNDNKVIGFDEGIKMGLSDCKMLGIILGYVGEIILGLDVEKKS